MKLIDFMFSILAGFCGGAIVWILQLVIQDNSLTFQEKLFYGITLVAFLFLLTIFVFIGIRLFCWKRLEKFKD